MSRPRGAHDASALNPQVSRLSFRAVRSLAQTTESVTVEGYLAEELQSETKHEYLGGVVYAMAGASEEHNVIAANLLGMLYARLRGKVRQPFGSDMKVRLETLGEPYFYYPDAMIACDPTDSGHGWRERPAVLFEIVSEETRRVDEREKRFAYVQIQGLEAYVRIEQGRAEVVIERRGASGWESERVLGTNGVVQLAGVGVELGMQELYERLGY